jgi:hypothetical protein
MLDDSSHTQIKSEIDRIAKNIDAILKKVASLDPNSEDNSDVGKNAAN